MKKEQQQQEIEFTELIPFLPEEIALECLTRLHFSTHRVSARVCKRWREILLSKDFYYHRKKFGFTRKYACLVQALPAIPSDSKPVGQASYGITIFDPVTCTLDWVDPIPKYPFGLPLFCQVASTEGKLVIMGGWNPANWEPVKDVFVYEFTTREWTQCADMPSTRSFFAVGAMEGKVFVSGGHDESKNALDSAWVFDIVKNEWTELARMSETRDECEGVIIGSEFWVVSGYDTSAQGEFKSDADAYNIQSGEWRRVENVWQSGKCPRSSVGVVDGKLMCWTGSDPAVEVGGYGVDLDEQTVVTGSAYQGGPHGVYLLDKKKGQNGKLVKVEVADVFSGFVQSGCCVEV